MLTAVVLAALLVSPEQPVMRNDGMVCGRSALDQLPTPYYATGYARIIGESRGRAVRR